MANLDTSSSPGRQAGRRAIAWKALLIAAVASFPWVFMKGLVGDAVIHLVFAENALQGHWFSFNPGEPSGGESSPGYLLLVMGLLRLLGPGAAPQAMSALGYAAWMALLAAGVALARTVVPRGPWRWYWLGLVGLMPGSVINSVVGMENVLLGAAVMLLLLWLQRSGAMNRHLGRPRELALALLLGTLTWVRPEAYLLAIVLLGYRAWRLSRSIGSRAWAEQAALALVVTLALLASLLLVTVATGDLPHTAGIARLNLAAAGGWLVGGVLPLHAKMLLRLLAYAPLGLMFGLGIRAMARSTRDEVPPIVATCALLVLVFAVAFSTILPSAHLARYTIFFWPLLALVGVFGLSRWASARRRAVVVGAAAALGVLQLGVYGYELSLRGGMGPRHSWSELGAAVGDRAETTDALIAWLGHRGPLPVSVGLLEVQLRYFVDDRVIVRSLDGIVDGVFNEHVRRSPGGLEYDYLGYLRARRVDYLMEYPDLDTGSGDWSPHALEALSPGTVIEDEGVRFERLGGGATRLTYLPAPGR